MTCRGVVKERGAKKGACESVCDIGWWCGARNVKQVRYPQDFFFLWGSVCNDDFEQLKQGHWHLPVRSRGVLQGTLKPVRSRRQTP